MPQHAHRLLSPARKFVFKDLEDKAAVRCAFDGFVIVLGRVGWHLYLDVDHPILHTRDHAKQMVKRDRRKLVQYHAWKRSKLIGQMVRHNALPRRETESYHQHAPER
jgi:hypothetical protein